MATKTKKTRKRSKLKQAYFDAAKKEHHRDGDIEIDDNAVVSVSEDGGAYVQAWIWVSNDEADICATPKCGNSLADGEGFDGYCGSCADKREAAGLNDNN